MRQTSLVAALAASLFLSSSLMAAPPPALVGVEQAPAAGSIAATSLTLENRAVQAVWSLAGNQLVLKSFQDRLNGTRIAPDKPAFTLVLGNGTTISSGKLAPAGQPVLIPLAANPAATTAHHIGIDVVFTNGLIADPDGRVLLFSFLCNNFTVPTRAVEQVQDAILVRLAASRGLR